MGLLWRLSFVALLELSEAAAAVVDLARLRSSVVVVAQGRSMMKFFWFAAFATGFASIL
jgi:hypothetical protein